MGQFWFRQHLRFSICKFNLVYRILVQHASNNYATYFFISLVCDAVVLWVTSQIRQEDRWAWPSGMFERMEETTGGQEKQLENQRHQAVVQTRQLEWQALVLTDAAAFVHGQLSILWLVMALSCFEVRYSIKGKVQRTDRWSAVR